ncbi:MAG: sel1 repeat family protein [Neomegalonema sp.]|nr:sel1 repeat family protein [Neomegalonema sp.]
MRSHLLSISFMAIATTAFAEPSATVENDFGILNPDDTGRAMLLRKIEMGARDSVTCSLAFNSTKYDDHRSARFIARVCAEAGIVKAMTWMSSLEGSGVGGPPDPKAAAMWNRRAAEAGDPIGKFNYGVDLLRGSGVAQDVQTGRKLVDQAASLGVEVAQQLAKANYDLSVITPDVEE